ncbi:hypothetical protein N657DRAFT_683158 [Parathielavia appendiculata]|uniref:C2H2-type domain-containing protein n=1 Tax=Parathielavia appendiculata TaxID=2587402 RepID=A0AAN6Z0M2_9PEZI|nr:hypothetical protein N657DRAFT_683158 [Parathielavia appendiculata]
MEPSSKRRRLAPKIPDPPAVSTFQPHAQAQPLPHTLPQDQIAQQHDPPTEAVPRLTERDEFEAFARHLQDAAIYIQQQTLKPKHTSVSVLMLRWEEDTSVEPDLLALENVFRERYHYHTEKWAIPTVPNPSIKLGVQMASFLENARPDHLLVIYYAGHGYVGPDNQLYWACNSREDAAKLKWDGVRCLFEDAQSEILLLIDSCAVRDAPMAGSHGVKQAIAAYTPDQSSLEAGPRSFTATLIETLQKLSISGRPFGVQKLYDDLRQQRQQESAQALVKQANGPTKPNPAPVRSPAFFTLTPAKGQGIILFPLDPETAQLQSPPHSAEADAPNAWRSKPEYGSLSPEEVFDLTLDEQRVLVCTTFVGDASPDMAFFNQWLHKMPANASKITVEGMFLGPPTMLLISMPHGVWNIVQHDKVCCFLGYISSHNMIHLYQRLVNSHPSGVLGVKDSEDGRPLKRSSSIHRGESSDQYPPVAMETPQHQAGAARPGAPAQASPEQTTSVGPKDEVEDSAEMQEAAEQLKALSHVRHLGGGTPAALERQTTRIGDSIAVRHTDDPGSPSEGVGPGVGGKLYEAEYNTPSAKPKARKPLQKQTPKQEVRCDHCSHAPFKDSSSLRKHVAAAHTRPFPCAFSFAGCSSTFGSKNEWKRHISSQHLCLQYYRCSACPQSSGADGKGNEFNRKDLFTQHLRRMHAPFAIKKAISKGDSKLQAEWEAHVKDMQASCLVTRRQPPQRSACPKPDCQTVFEGSGSWDEWTEHVGRHMEKGEANRMGVDRLLAKWALDEGIIESVVNGEYRLCGQSMNGSGPIDLGPVSTNGGKAPSDSGRKTEDDDDPSITVAMPMSVAGDIDVD